MNKKIAQYSIGLTILLVNLTPANAQQTTQSKRQMAQDYVLPQHGITLQDLSRILGTTILSPEQNVLDRHGNEWIARDLLALANQMESDLRACGRSLLEPGDEIEFAPPLSQEDHILKYGDTSMGNIGLLAYGTLTRPYSWKLGNIDRIALYGNGNFTGKGNLNQMVGESTATIGGSLRGATKEFASFTVSGTAKKKTNARVSARVKVKGKDVYVRDITGTQGKYQYTDNAILFDQTLIKKSWKVDIGPITASIEAGIGGQVGIDYIVGVTSGNPTVESIVAPYAKLNAWGTAGGSYMGFGVKLKIDMDPLFGYSAPHTLAAYTVPSEQRLRARLDHDLVALRGRIKVKLETPVKDWSWTLWEDDGVTEQHNIFDETKRGPIK